MPTQEQVQVEQLMKTLLLDRKKLLETLFTVENKERQVVPYKMSPIIADMQATSTGRDIYVKPGQIGATTWNVVDFLADNLIYNGTVSVVVSYDDFSAQRQLIKAKKFYSSVASILPSVPKLDHKSATELTFINPDTRFYSVMYIFSARSYTIGRGETIHNLLLDEFAFWPPGTHEEIFASAVQRVPLKRGTKIRVCSTANGQENMFYEMYEAAKENKAFRASVYAPHFYTWYQHPEYSMDKDSIFCLPGDDIFPLADIQAEEATLLLKFQAAGVSEEEAHNKLRWRRYKATEMQSLRRSGDTLFIFPQEYPEDDVTCFLTAGNMAHDSDIINSRIHNCYPATTRKQILNVKNGLSATAEIWLEPETNRSYLLAIDPGKAKVSESVGYVIYYEDEYEDKDGKKVPGRIVHCATISGLYDEWEMAQYCMELGRYYNNAIIAPEDNLDIVSHLRDYPELYYRESPRDGRIVMSVGWQTTTSTKPYMVTEINVNLDIIECKDIRFWKQAKNIRRDPTSKSGIKSVGADDHYMAMALAVVCRKSIPANRGFVGQAGWDDNWGN